MEQKTKNTQSGDRRLISDAAEILEGTSKKSALGRLLPFLGPAFIASVAYVDPGNFATNIRPGARGATLWQERFAERTQS
jgi:manganese transport protein